MNRLYEKAAFGITRACEMRYESGKAKVPSHCCNFHCCSRQHPHCTRRPWNINTGVQQKSDFEIHFQLITATKSHGTRNSWDINVMYT
jgi:hypothetical protein